VADLYSTWTSLVARAIGLFAPGAARNFIYRRQALRSYLAAQTKGPNQLWRPKNKSADAHLLKDNKLILARSRDLVRNSTHVGGALRKIVNNVVFTGIKPQAQLKTKEGKLKKKQNKLVEEHWKMWAESKEIQFYDLQELALRHLWQDGEFLLHYFFDKTLLDKGIVPLGVEFLECDHLDESIHGELANGNIAKRGIEFDRLGRPVAYWLFETHPGDDFGWKNSKMLAWQRSKRIPAEEIEHVFVRERASQTRGVSWLATVIMEMKDFDEYQTSERIAARLAAAFGIFVETPFPEHFDPGVSPLGGESPENKEDLPDYIDPGRIQYLPPGCKISVASHNRPGQSYEPFTKISLKGASTGMGMSYEAFSNDYTDASYSSARSAALEERRGYIKQQTILNRKFNNPVWKKWAQYLYLSGLAPGIPMEIPVNWQAPGWPWVDPLKDSKAAETELRLGITTRRKLAADRGMDWDEVVEQLAREQEILREKNLEGGDDK